MESEDLRAALRAAAAAVRDVIRWTDADAEADRAAVKELEEVIGTLTRLRATLELGDWPGRSVQPYPESRERMLDGTR